jgi:starvation-inducible DNA-binding protein
MGARALDVDVLMKQAAPVTGENAAEVHPYGHLVPMPLALGQAARTEAVTNLNQLLADTMVLRDLYRKHHWQVAGPEFAMLHAMFDTHYRELDQLVDALAERVQLLGGVSIAMPHDVAAMTLIPRPPKGREAVAVQLGRLMHAHEVVLKEARTMARLASEADDAGTNDLIVSQAIRLNERQVWFLAAQSVRA